MCIDGGLLDRGEGGRGARERGGAEKLWYSVYLLYWDKGTNTDVTCVGDSNARAIMVAGGAGGCGCRGGV